MPVFNPPAEACATVMYAASLLGSSGRSLITAQAMYYLLVWSQHAELAMKEVERVC